MKLLYFTDRDLRKGNAEAVHVLEVVRALAAQGHDVSLVSPVDATVPSAVRLIVYGDGNLGGNRLRRMVQQLVIGPVTATRHMRAEDYDGMYVRLTVPLLPTTWLLRWACNGRPLIFEINGIGRSELGLRRRVLYAPFLPFEGLLVSRADALVAVSEPTRIDLIQRYDPAKVTTVPNGVDPDAFTPGVRAEARRQLGLNESDPLIGFIGSFAPWHGVEVLLRALPLIREKHPDARIMLVGDGSNRQAIVEEIDRLGIVAGVDMVGSVSHELISSYINACSCCVSPAIPMGNSDPGRNSLKVFEYLACGVPVVLSDLPGVADLVKDRKLGIAVPPNDHTSLANAISEVLAYDKSTLDRIRRDARAAVIQNFSWDANVTQVVKLFSEHMTGDVTVVPCQQTSQAGHESNRSPN